MIEPPSGNFTYADVWGIEAVTFGVIEVIGSVDRFSDIPLFFHNFTVPVPSLPELPELPVAIIGSVG